MLAGQGLLLRPRMLKRGLKVGVKLFTNQVWFLESQGHTSPTSGVFQLDLGCTVETGRKKSGHEFPLYILRGNNNGLVEVVVLVD